MEKTNNIISSEIKNIKSTLDTFKMMFEHPERYDKRLLFLTLCNPSALMFIETHLIESYDIARRFLLGVAGVYITEFARLNQYTFHFDEEARDYCLYFYDKDSPLVSVDLAHLTTSIIYPQKIQLIIDEKRIQNLQKDISAMRYAMEEYEKENLQDNFSDKKIYFKQLIIPKIHEKKVRKELNERKEFIINNETRIEDYRLEIQNYQNTHEYRLKKDISDKILSVIKLKK